MIVRSWSLRFLAERAGLALCGLQHLGDGWIGDELCLWSIVRGGCEGRKAASAYRYMRATQTLRQHVALRGGPNGQNLCPKPVGDKLRRDYFANIAGDNTKDEDERP